MNKLFIGLAMVLVLSFAGELIEPGTNNLLRSDMTTFSNEHIVGAGDTIWTTTYHWSTEITGGAICYFSVDIDTFAACSCKVEFILEEGNTDGDWDYVASFLTINHAPADFDTSFEFNFGPMEDFRIGTLSKNGTNDSDKVSNEKLFVVK